MTTENPNRIPDPPVTVANAATDKALTPVSPTGAPWLPVKFVPYLAALVAVAAVLPTLPGMPVVVVSISTVVVAIGVAIGIVSPGLRKHG